MALPGSGVITLNDLKTEFGGPTSPSLSDYYRGGTYVPNISANSAVPTSGAISLSNFYGASNQLVNITNRSISSIGVNVGTRAGIELRNNGIAYNYRTNAGTYTTIAGEWMLAGAASDYEVYCAVTSGTLTVGTVNTWLALSTTRLWYLQRSVLGVITCDITLTIRKAGVNLMAANITLEASRTNEA